MKTLSLKKWFDLSYFEARVTAALAVFTTSSGFMSRAADWPWTEFLEDLVDEFRGPLAVTLGTLGLIYICYGALTGDGARAVRNTIVLVFAMAILFFAPDLIEMIQESAE